MGLALRFLTSLAACSNSGDCVAAAMSVFRLVEEKGDFET